MLSNGNKSESNPNPEEAPMIDPRNEILARQLLDYSVELKPGEVLYLEIKGRETLELGKQVIRLATERGGVPF